uniref:CSON004069 protein n=1 Tax=Culicoides sonorensis TaxID=179676 RepID=A0A336LTE2_CULSO
MENNEEVENHSMETEGNENNTCIENENSSSGSDDDAEQSPTAEPISGDAQQNAQAFNLLNVFPMMELLQQISHNQTTADLVEFNNRLVAENERLKQQYEKAHLEKISLKQDLDLVKSLFAQVQIEMAQCEEGYNSLVDAVEESKKFEKRVAEKTEYLEKALAESCNSKDYNEMKEKLTEMEQKFDNVSQEKDRLKGELDSLLIEMKNVENANANLQEELQQTKEKFINAEHQLKDNGISISTLREKEEQMKQFIGNLRDEITRITNEAETKAKEYEEALKALHEEMEQKQGEHQHIVQTMYEGLKEAQSIVQRTTVEMNNQSDQIDDLNVQNEVLRQENDDFRQQNTELLRRIQNFESSLSDSKNFEQENITMKAKLDSVCNELSDVKKQLFEYNRRELNQQKLLDEKEKEILSLKRHILKNGNETPEPLLPNMNASKTSTPKDPQQQVALNYLSETESVSNVKSTKKPLPKPKLNEKPIATVNAAQQQELQAKDPPRRFFKHIQTPGKSSPNVTTASKCGESSKTAAQKVPCYMPQKKTTKPSQSSQQSAPAAASQLECQSSESDIFAMHFDMLNNNNDDSDSDTDCLIVSSDSLKKEKN